MKNKMKIVYVLLAFVLVFPFHAKKQMKTTQIPMPCCYRLTNQW